MPGFRWEMAHDLVLAKEVSSQRPQKPVDWIYVADRLSSQFSTEDKPVLLKGRGCKERLELLLKKYREEDAKSLKKSGCEEEYSELLQILEDIHTFLRDLAEEKSSEVQSAAKRKFEDRKRGESMRNAAMQGLTKLSSSSSSSVSSSIDLDADSDEPAPPKHSKGIKQSRKAATELMQEKFERRAQLKEEELKIRREELELQKRKMDLDEEERRKRFELEQQERKAFISLLLNHVQPKQ